MFRFAPHRTAAFAATLAGAALLALGPGCTRSSENRAPAPVVRDEYRSDARGDAPPPRRTASREAAASEDLATPEERKGLLGRIFAKETPAGYGWDGTYSVVNTTAAIETVHTRAIAALRGLNFTINASQSTLQGGSGKVIGARKDGTTVEVLMSGTPGSPTEIKAKVGQLGDRTSSERILDDIQRPRRR